MIIRKIKLTEYEYQPPINYVAGATEPDIQFQFADYTIPAGATARCYVQRFDGTFEYTIATIDGNSVTVEPTSSMFSVRGEGAIQITLYAGEEVLKNFSVPVFVHADLADENAEQGSDVTGIFRAAEEQALEDFQEAAEAKAEEVIESIPEDYTTLTEEVSELNERLSNNNIMSGIAASKGVYGNNKVLFTSSVIQAGTTIYYKFSAQTGKSGYIEFLDGNGVRISYIGKGSSSGGALDYEGIYVLPSNFVTARVITNGNLTIEYILTDLSNTIINAKVDNAVKTIGVILQDKEFLNNDTVLTLNDVHPGDVIYYSFDSSTTTTGYLALMDVNDNVLMTIGKTAGGYSSHYEDLITLPSDFNKAVAVTNAGSKLSFDYILTSYANIPLEQNNKILENTIFQNVGILQESDLINGTNYVTNDNMYKYVKVNGNFSASRPIDIRSFRTKIFTIMGVGGVACYDADGTFKRNIANANPGVPLVIDLSHHNIAYLRFGVSTSYRKKMWVVPGLRQTGFSGFTFGEHIDTQLMINRRSVFLPGDNSTQLHRMPFCTFTPSGVLLIGAEKRENGGVDNNGNSIEFCRSLDGGKTFTDYSVLLPYEDKGNTYQSMACGQFIVDKYTGRIFLFALRENSNINRIEEHPSKADYDSDITYIYSDDDGKTWSEKNSFDLRDDDMTIMVPSPSHGLTMNDGTLVMPAWFLNVNGGMHSCIIYSEDHGETWTYSGVSVSAQTSESIITVLPDNETLLLDCRNEGGTGYRLTYTTTDLGQTYTEIASSNYAMQQPPCSASIIRKDLQGDIIYFYCTPTKTGRSHIKLFATRDFNIYKDLATIERVGGNGYTMMDTFKNVLVVCLESLAAPGGIQCASINISQLELGTGKIKLPITDMADLVKGELSYDPVTEKLVFVDRNGQTKYISFDA